MIQILLLLIPLFSWSKVDLNMGLQGRTTPGLGAELYADSGYNYLLWGKRKTSADVKYGLLRPSVGAATSGVINSATAKLEFFPISFIGLSVGRQYIHSNFDFPFFNCEEVTCKGGFERNWITSKMAIGAKGFIAIGSYSVQSLKGPRENRPIADWKHVILANDSEEIQIERKLILGKVFSNNLVGVLLEHVQFQESREFKESYAAIYQFRHKQTNYMLGAGSFHSSQQPHSFVLYFRIHHIHLPTMKLF